MIVELYTDGSATSFNKPGGWAFVVLVDGIKVHSESGGLQNATNNIAEITAAVKALTYASAHYPNEDITLVSDSKLVLGYADGSYQCRKIHLALLHNQVSTLFKSLKAKTKWVKGHNGNTYNEECDVLAKNEREKLMEDK